MSWVGILVMGLIAATVGLILWSGLSGHALKGRSVDDLEEVIPGLRAHRAKAVVYCFSDHCGPCRKLGPELDRLQEHNPNLFKLDVGRHRREAAAIGVRATPTTLLVEDGKVLKALLGAGAAPAVEVFLSARQTQQDAVSQAADES